jgi:uncharacterized membrane protein
MSKSFLNDLSELRDVGIIDEQTEQRIRVYYAEKGNESSDRQKLILSILGAVLIALGFILIVSYNWELLSQHVRAGIILGMLGFAQAFCAFTLWKYSDSVLWRESAGAVLFLVAGATLPLLSSIYNISGNPIDFLLLWLLLGLPIVFIMNSTVTAIVSIGVITVYFAQMGYNTTGVEKYYPWLLLIPVVVYGYQQLKHPSITMFTRILHWFIPVAVLIMLGSLVSESDELAKISYAAVGSIFYLIAFNQPFSSAGRLDNPYRITGLIASTVLLIILSFHSGWGDVDFQKLWQPIPVLVTALLFLFAEFLLIRTRKSVLLSSDPFDYVFIVVTVAVLLQWLNPLLSFIWINLFLVFLAWKMISEGAKKLDFGTLNFGLLIAVILIISRFFDGNFSSLTRGLVFIALGIGFIAANLYFLKRKKAGQ